MGITALELQHFGDPALNEQDLLARLAWLRDAVAPRLERFLGYYRNPTSSLAAAYPCPANACFPMRPYRQFQELGLPARITGFRRAADGRSACGPGGEFQRKEVVIENDIAWRMDTLVDFVAGRLPGITSTAADPETRARLTPVIAAILESAVGRSGGGGCVSLLQELTQQGLIGGSAWVHVRPTAELLSRLGGGSAGGVNSESPPADLTRWFKLEVLDARSVCPVPQAGGNTCDAAMGPAYVVVMRECNADAVAIKGGNGAANPGGFLNRVRAWFGGGADLGGGAADPAQFSFDIFGPNFWQRYDAGILTDEGENALGVVPFMRYENAPDPAAGTVAGNLGSGAVDAGIGDVEPLVGMQDELNTRLSDRAYRVTMSSFRMFLGKGIEDFIKRPIGPGQMWGTDNPDAAIEAFGGDQDSPSEDSHINEVREALDKISGVPPVAAGVLREKLGNLSSAIALRITLIALLSRTDRKRAALTRTLFDLVRMVLSVLDAAGVVASAPEDRGIDVNWPTALPESDMDRLTEAQAKLAVGIPRSVVLTELGYGDVAEAETRVAARGAGEATDAPGNALAAGGAEPVPALEVTPGERADASQEAAAGVA